MNRRQFMQALAAASAGIILPYEPERIYSFPTKRITTAEQWYPHPPRVIFETVHGLPQQYIITTRDGAWHFHTLDTTTPAQQALADPQKG